jgi:hypothetical protein
MRHLGGVSAMKVAAEPVPVSVPRPPVMMYREPEALVRLPQRRMRRA